MRHILTLLAGLAVLVAATSTQALERPKGDVILTVVGARLSHPNVDGAAEFDMAMLETLTQRSGSMQTPWTSGTVKFSGPLLRAVLDAAGAQGQTLKVGALNDYSANVPVEDATGMDTMLATRMDGKPMSVRDKGPLFLVYPFDVDPSLYNEKYFSRSVWQINRIEVSE
jgi:hypothetical protein